MRHQHPARKIPYTQLHTELEKRVGLGLIRRQVNGRLTQYTYTEKCTQDKAWDEYTSLARGLILNTMTEKVQATPFPKFFNVGEVTSIPDLPFEAFEKLDGSLIIAYNYIGTWQTATKGSFMSDQALWAKREIGKYTPMMKDGYTYLFEAIYPENRIVVNYGFSGLFLLAVYNEDGHEITYDSLLEWTKKCGMPIAVRHHYNNVAELLALAKRLPVTEEGFVLRFSDGTRLKIKGDEYCRIHRLVSRITPLAMWEALWKGDDLNEVRRELPEEFWEDFDVITDILKTQVTDLMKEVEKLVERVAPLTDKQIGLSLSTIPERLRPFVFAARKGPQWAIAGRTKDTLWRTIRPTGNYLKGYVPSSSMNKLAETE